MPVVSINDENKLFLMKSLYARRKFLISPASKDYRYTEEPRSYSMQ